MPVRGTDRDRGTCFHKSHPQGCNKEMQRFPPWASPQDARDFPSVKCAVGWTPLTPTYHTRR